ncbi:MAG: TonB-dependent receptor [Sphingomonadales bacterium]|nr:TonB-dependent receptor [Sphingomonadales bacterium]
MHHIPAAASPRRPRTRAGLLARTILGLCCTVSSAGLLAPAQAQTGAPTDRASEAASEAGADIVVTARRTSERLQDVPIAVTALSGQALEARGLAAVTDLQQVSPNLQFTPGTGGNSGAIAPFIRGVGENDFIITADPAVGTYFDGVYVARTFGASAEILDVERVEVLRGPQGSLFGKNTVGGAINVVTRLPGTTRELEGDLRYGSYNDVRLRARLATPLGEGLSLGLSALGQWGDGWQKLPSGQTLGNRNVVSGRGVLRYVAGPFEAVAAVDGLRRRQNSAAHAMLAFSPTFFSFLQSTFIAPCCTVPGQIDRTDTSPQLNRDDADAINSSLTLSYDLGAARVKSISAYRWVHAQFGRDGDASSTVNYAGDFHNERARQFSQELQLTAPIFGTGNLLLGAYYFRESTIDLTHLTVADGLFKAPGFASFSSTVLGIPPAFLDYNIDFDNRQTTTNLALFGNASVPLTPAVTLELGGRYTHEKKSFFQAANRVDSNTPLLFGTPSYTLARSWDAFTPRVSLSYRVRPEVLAYASWSQGFRSGGFNGRPTSLEEIGSYNPERLDAFEVGVKSQIGRVLTLNLAAFRNQYRDQQLLISTVSKSTGLIVVRTENVGRSRIQGLELEGTVRVSPRLRIEAALGLLDARYQNYVSVIAGVPTDVSGRTPKQSPDLTGNLGLAYTLPLGTALEATFRADAAYRSRNYIDVENTPELVAPDHAIVNLSTTFSLPEQGIKLRLAVDNVTNRRIITAGYDARSSFGFLEGYFNEPRRFWVTLSYRN